MEHTKKLVAKYEGLLKIGNMELPCAVLNDGTRVLTQTAVFKALGRPARGNSRVINIPTFMDAKNLQKYITEDVMPMIKKIEYADTKGKDQTGYNCLILPVVCDIYLKARENEELHPSQLDSAKSAEILVRSLAKVGIIALVDEATGYQYDRERRELQKILKAYISEELLAWQKRFPDIYYRELFRLNNWDFTVNGIKKRPSVIGRWTNILVYEQLPKGVLDKLKEKTPKSRAGNYTARFHQSLSLDVGEPNLTAQITKVIALFQVADNMEQLWGLFKKMRNREQGQLDIPFEFDDCGYTKEPHVSTPIDARLKQALNFSD